MIYLAAVLGYLGILIIVGLYKKKQVHNTEDFMVAGRSLSVFVLVGTLVATWMGSGSLFGHSDLAYHNGLAQLWASAGAWIGIILCVFLASRVRKLERFTVTDILALRYNDTARVLATIITIIGYITIVSYQFKGGGKLLNIITSGQLSVEHGIIITALFATFYTMIAGMLSVTYTDVVNGIVMIVGLLIALPLLVIKAGGLSMIYETAIAPQPVFGQMGAVKALAYFVPGMLLLMGDANMYQRFFSAKSAGVAKTAVVWWLVGVIFVEVLISFSAITGSVIIPGLGVGESDAIIVKLAVGSVPVWIGCMMMAAMAAIIVSTADSFLLVPATNIIRDIYQRYFGQGKSDKQLLAYSRWAVLLLACWAYVMVSFFPRILNAAYAAYTIYGAGITPALLAAFLWKRATSQGAVCSIALGGLTTIVWEVATKSMGHEPFGLAAIFPAATLSIAGLVIVSLMTPAPSQEKLAPFA